MDRILTQIMFKKVLWACPSCGQEDTEDFNVGGGNTYEHNCSNCSTHFNQSGSNMREYNGCINIAVDDYATMTPQDVASLKQERFDAWVTMIKNPPAYVEPSKEDYENLYLEKTKEADEYLVKYAEKATLSELIVIKDNIVAKVVMLEGQIVSMTPPPLEEL